jgi:hypothetical protein
MFVRAETIKYAYINCDIIIKKKRKRRSNKHIKLLMQKTEFVT